MKKELIVEIIIAAAFFALTVLCLGLAYVTKGQVGVVAAFMFVAGALAVITFGGVMNILCILGIVHGC